jgi:4-hydroxybenzoate polyprenyltransferase
MEQLTQCEIDLCSTLRWPQSLYNTYVINHKTVMEGIESALGKHESIKVSTSISDYAGTKVVTSFQKAVNKTSYHAYTLLLFTSDTMIDMVIPSTALGVLAALSGSALDLPSQQGLDVLQRIPKVLIWLWLMVLQFCLQNQRHASSVQEDAINKPWRPIPAGRINRTQTNQLLLATYLITVLVSYHLRVVPIYVAWAILITAYNDTGVSDYSGIVRNVFAGAGFTCTFSGALSIALGPHNPISYTAWQWTLLVTFGIIGTTIQTQEFRDEAGDRARGRRTVVIELGRKYALGTVVVTVAFWAVYAPLGFLGARWEAAALSIGLGALLVGTAMWAVGLEDRKLDRQMYKLWCLWLCSFAGLPLFATVFPSQE